MMFQLLRSILAVSLTAITLIQAYSDPGACSGHVSQIPLQKSYIFAWQLRTLELSQELQKHIPALRDPATKDSFQAL